MKYKSKFYLFYSLVVIILIFVALSKKNNRNFIANEIQEKTIGPTKFEIDFKVRKLEFSTNRTGKNTNTAVMNYASWINIENPDSEIGNLIESDSIVLPYPSAKIFFNYPIYNTFTIEISSRTNGFSRRELIKIVSSLYHHIYKHKRQYEVWGHDISDLDLAKIEVHKDIRGKITLTLEVES